MKLRAVFIFHYACAPLSSHIKWGYDKLSSDSQSVQNSNTPKWDAQLTLFTTSLSRITVRQLSPLACLVLHSFVKLSWLLLITVPMWPSVKSPLFSHRASPAHAAAAVQRFWCTRLISMEAVLVTIHLLLIKNTAAYRQGSILKMKCACINIR